MSKETKPKTERQKHGHPGNNFHKVEKPGMTTSFYLSGDELETLTRYLEQRGEPVNKTSLGKQARLWFHTMMEQKRDEFSGDMKTH